MNVVNETAFEAGWNVGFQPDGREVAVVIVKATYKLRHENRAGPSIAEEQAPLLESDEFGEDPANDAPIRENDFALTKPRCDILIHALAYAPEGRPVEKLDVGFRVADCAKSFRVVGERVWVRSLGRVVATKPIPFVTRDISYDVAYGGTDVDPDDPSRIRTYVQNPVGTGYCPTKKNIDGTRLPTTEKIGNQVASPTGEYTPMGLGPIGRNWDPRSRFAGTYDDTWLAAKVPFLPDDFDNRYYQAAPADRQIPYPRGGEPITLSNLSAEGELTAQLPREGIYVSFIRKRGDAVLVHANLDTIVLQPETDRMYLTWRVTQPLNRDMFELREVIVEQKSRFSRARTRARMTGKTYYRGLDDLVKSRRAR